MLGGGGNFVDFAMDGVLFDLNGGDGPEGAEPDVQSQVGAADPLGGQFAEQFGREVQTRGRSCSGDLMSAVGIDRLITLAIEVPLFLAVSSGDVRRQRHFADAVGDRKNVAVVGREGHAREPVGGSFPDGGREEARQAKGGADREFFARTQQAPPFVAAGGGTEQKAFDPTAGRPRGMQPGGDDGGVVAEEAVSGPEKSRQFVEVTMLDGVRGAVHDEQPGLIAPFGGFLGDEPFRELIVK